MSDIIFRALPADDGDCLLISFHNNAKTNILIDGGTSRAFRNNAKTIEKVFAESGSNHIIVTHIDDDHIQGIVTLFSDTQYKDIVCNVSGVYYNSSAALKKYSPNSFGSPPILTVCSTSPKTSALNGKKLEELLSELNIPYTDELILGSKYVIDDINITILSPAPNTLEKYKNWLDKQFPAKTSALRDYSKSITELNRLSADEDTSPTNGSSLAMLIEYKNKLLLLLGDAYPSVISDALIKLGYSETDRISADIVKVSHHGSKHNTTDTLMKMIRSPRFVISTNGVKHQLPHKQALSKIIVNQPDTELIFNYPIFHRIFSEEDHREYSFSTFLTDKGGIEI